MGMKYAPAFVTLRGLLHSEHHYGPPNYGLTPLQDMYEGAIILRLDTPIDIDASEAAGEEGVCSVGRRGVRELHLVPMAPDRGHAPWESFLGHVVEVTGQLYPAHTGHHRRDVLIFCDEGAISPISAIGPQTVEDTAIKARGSGVVISSDGHILTSLHVVDGAAYTVRAGLHRSTAELVGREPALDVALLRADLPSVRVPDVRLSSPPFLGERVYVCGFPLRPILTHNLSITDGLVSGFNLPVDGCFHISAPVQRGNSGGPVFDAMGNVLGFVRGYAAPQKILEKLGAPVGATGGIEVLNQAVAAYSLRVFLAQQGVTVSDVGFWHSVPMPSEHLPGTEIAHRAMQNCVEVESWR